MSSIAVHLHLRSGKRVEDRFTMGFSTLAAYRLELEHQLSSIGLKLGLNCMTNGKNGRKVDEKGTIKQELVKTGGKRMVVDFRDEMDAEWARTRKENEVDAGKMENRCKLLSKTLQIEFSL